MQNLDKVAGIPTSFAFILNKKIVAPFYFENVICIFKLHLKKWEKLFGVQNLILPKEGSNKEGIYVSKIKVSRSIDKKRKSVPLTFASIFTNVLKIFTCTNAVLASTSTSTSELFNCIYTATLLSFTFTCISNKK